MICRGCARPVDHCQRCETAGRFSVLVLPPLCDSCARVVMTRLEPKVRESEQRVDAETKTAAAAARAAHATRLDAIADESTTVTADMQSLTTWLKTAQEAIT